MHWKHSPILILFFACVAAGCSRSERNPSKSTQKALENANLSDVTVDWDPETHVAYLKGTVETPTDRQRAESVAAAVLGTSGKVKNELSITGPVEETPEDLDIQLKGELNKILDTDHTLRARDIDFDVTGGNVIVKGRVNTEAERDRVTQLLHAAPGVKSLSNRLALRQ